MSPIDRLSTTDEKGNRIYLYPADVSGKYKNLKWKIHAILMLAFLILPWIYFRGRQLLLLDISHREFFFFGLHFRAHDAPLIVFFFLTFAFLIAFVSAIWGRAWCGWACPQTVFTEFVFRKIERWIEGNHRQRKLLDDSPWTNEKFRKKILKYGIFLFVSLIITHSFLAYFVGSRELIEMIYSSPEKNWGSFLVILGTTTLILFDFGWFREQFCTIMCPYGRLQSVMLDSHSTIVGYNAKRGEPRRDVLAPTKNGDCVNCYRCVQVCPTGIDIRNGLQMECIGCTACIDACDEVMIKIKKPKGLIRYTTLAELAGNNRSRLTIRAITYGVIFLVSVLGLITILSKKEFLDVTILRAGGSPYEILAQNNAEAIVVNHFRVDLSNQTEITQNIAFSTDSDLLSPQITLTMPMNPITLTEGSTLRADFFLQFPQTILEHGSKKIYLNMKSENKDRKLEVTLVGPNA